MGYRVFIHFEGAIEVDIAADPIALDLWDAALADAWAEVSPEATSEAVSTIEYEIVGVKNTETCDDCGGQAPYIIGCPDGAEICQPCFDAGTH